MRTSGPGRQSRRKGDPALGPNRGEHASEVGHSLIVGGAGYIGTQLADFLLSSGRASKLTIADINPPEKNPGPNIQFQYCDVRTPLEDQIALQHYDWIFNLAAVHREPGHADNEYFETNIQGAKNVCAYAEKVGCTNIFFSSSIAVYGVMDRPVTESSPTVPNTAYGISKLAAELIHEAWRRASPLHRLAIVRPGVIYGPGDPGNIGRMIQAIKKGYFVVPSTNDIKKSYGYVFGLLDSIAYVIDLKRSQLTYNYVERETETLADLVRHTAEFLGLRRPVLRAPVKPLMAAARVLQFLSLGAGDIHVTRVRKAASSTHVIPKRLIEAGFKFRFGFRKSLSHWRELAPKDFL